MIRFLFGVLVFVGINTFSAEYLFNKSSFAGSDLLALVILLVTLVFLVIKPLKKQLKKLP